MQKTTTPATDVPQPFLNRFGDQILGTLCGFDRLRLRGILRHLFQPTVMEAYLNASGVLIKDFGAFAQKLSARVRAAAYQLAEKLGRPVQSMGAEITSAIQDVEPARGRSHDRDILLSGEPANGDIIEIGAR